MDEEQSSAKQYLSRCILLVPTAYFCIKEEKILQLWIDEYSIYKEWRPLKSFEEASKESNCHLIIGE